MDSSIGKTFLKINIYALYVCSGLFSSLLPLLFPLEAEKKNATKSQIGFVFGSEDCSTLICSFILIYIWQNYGTKIGAWKCFIVGSIIQGLSGLLFIVLPYVNSTDEFIGIACSLKAVVGLATSISWSASLGVSMTLFPDIETEVMWVTQGFFAFGYSLGSVIGVPLYEYGGFYLPFLVVSGFSTLVAFGLIFTLPNPSQTEPSHVENDQAEPAQAENRAKLRMWDIVSKSSIYMPFLHLCAFLCDFGMLESMLESHMKANGAVAYDVGMAFTIFGAFYAGGNCLVGVAMKKFGRLVMFSLLGNSLFMLVFIFIGPIPGIELGLGSESHVLLIQIMMALTGFAYSCMVVSSFSRVQKEVINMGYADDINTKVMIASAWIFAQSSGYCLGPWIGGSLVESLQNSPYFNPANLDPANSDFGFRATTLIFLCVFNIPMFLNDFYSLFRKWQSDQQSETRRQGYENIPGA